MAVRDNRSVETYLQQKKVMPEQPETVPLYEQGTLRPHRKPVTPDPFLDEVDMPSNKVVTT
jgi:hypothetical protein